MEHLSSVFCRIQVDGGLVDQVQVRDYNTTGPVVGDRLVRAVELLSRFRTPF